MKKQWTAKQLRDQLLIDLAQCQTSLEAEMCKALSWREIEQAEIRESLTKRTK